MNYNQYFQLKSMIFFSLLSIIIFIMFGIGLLSKIFSKWVVLTLLIFGALFFIWVSVLSMADFRVKKWPK